MKRKLFLMLLIAALLSGSVFLAPKAVITEAGAMQTYLVLYKQNKVPASAAADIAQAGGILVYSYDQIGVVIAQSDLTTFSAALLADKSVEGVSATGGLASQINDELEEVFDASGPPPGDLPNAPVSDEDPLFYLQWDMRQIHTPEAHAITGGSPDVVVGIIDTGIDYTHPDLTPNVDFSKSVSCLTGIPNPDPAVWSTGHWHGTHVAGTVAAAANGIGIVGVAPNVKLAAIQAGNADGYFFPEAVVCAFMWAAEQQIDVTNSSYYVDPWLYNCRNDPEQRAIWKSIQRAVNYAMAQGVTVVSAAGNENDDLAHPTEDTTSPDYPPGKEIDREVTNACLVLPNELPGVIGVSADGNLLQKSYYSSYGVGTTDVVAPGGDSRYQRTEEAPRGTVLSTYPGDRYAYAQGTSMASPHAAGVAALIISQYGKMPSGRVQAFLQQTADTMPCPPNPFDPSGTGRYLAICQGGDGYNGFYGHGQVNAFRAVTHATGE
jgi:subtilisin family serine protease